MCVCVRVPMTSLPGVSTFEAVKRKLPSPPSDIIVSAHSTSFTLYSARLHTRSGTPSHLWEGLLLSYNS